VNHAQGWPESPPFAKILKDRSGQIAGSPPPLFNTGTGARPMRKVDQDQSNFAEKEEEMRVSFSATPQAADVGQGL
jgi:hypothetical protein